MKIVGHRGAPKLVPENTLAGVKKCIELGIHAVEMDLRQTEDEEVILMHDINVARTTNGVGFIPQMTLDQIKELDAGSWFSKEFKGEEVPTLKEVIKIAKGKINLFLDIKYCNPQLLLDILEKKKMLKHVTFISFNKELMRELKVINKKSKVGALSVINFFAPWEKNEFDCYPAFWPLINPLFVMQAHKKGKEVNAWTVDNPLVFHYLNVIGVDSITTNHANRFKD